MAAHDHARPHPHRGGHRVVVVGAEGLVDHQLHGALEQQAGGLAGGGVAHDLAAGWVGGVGVDARQVHGVGVGQRAVPRRRDEEHRPIGGRGGEGAAVGIFEEAGPSEADQPGLVGVLGGVVRHLVGHGVHVGRDQQHDAGQQPQHRHDRSAVVGENAACFGFSGSWEHQGDAGGEAGHAGNQLGEVTAKGVACMGPHGVGGHMSRARGEVRRIGRHEVYLRTDPGPQVGRLEAHPLAQAAFFGRSGGRLQPLGLGIDPHNLCARPPEKQREDARAASGVDRRPGSAPLDDPAGQQDGVHGGAVAGLGLVQPEPRPQSMPLPTPSGRGHGVRGSRA